MQTFYYEALTKEGIVISDSIQSENEKAAINAIQNKGYFPLKIGVNQNNNKKTLSLSSLSLKYLSLKNKITQKDITIFSYQLSVLLDSGATLEKGLSILSELSEKESIRQMLKEILQAIRGGKSFSDALSRFQDIFGQMYINMVRAAESGGFLEITMRRMVIYFEESEKVKSEIRSSLIYPLLLSIISCVAIGILLMFVVPKFSSIFSDNMSKLPVPMLILLSVSSFLNSFWYLILGFIIIIYFGLRHYIKTGLKSDWWDNLKYKIPIFGKFYKEFLISQFARTFGTLLQSGVPILNGLKIIQGIFKSNKMVESIEFLIENVRKGRPISDSLMKRDIFPPFAIQMIAIGEDTNKLEETLIKVADRFDLEVRTTIKKMLSLLEPALILLMGFLVGFIVISMLLAIFSLNELPL